MQDELMGPTNHQCGAQYVRGCPLRRGRGGPDNRAVPSAPRGRETGAQCDHMQSGDKGTPHKRGPIKGARQTGVHAPRGAAWVVSWCERASPLASASGSWGQASVKGQASVQGQAWPQWGSAASLTVRVLWACVVWFFKGASWVQGHAVLPLRAQPRRLYVARIKPTAAAHAAPPCARAPRAQAP